jgi:CRISPR-associated endonuclease Cas2
MQEYIVCYDVSSPARLNRLHRHLLKYAIPIQYSVFLFSGDDRQLRRCLDTATGLIDRKEDDLRAYPLPTRGLKMRMGRPTLPEGILWSNLPAPW